MAGSIQEILEKYDLYARARGFSKPTIDHTRLSVTLFADFLPPGKDVSSITSNDFRRFVADLRQRSQRRPSRSGSPRMLSGTSVNTYARAVKAFFSWMNKEGIIATNPLSSEPSPKKPKTIPKVYRDSEMKAVFQKVMPDLRNKAIVFLFLSSGLRLAELSLLTVNTIHTGDGIATVMGKGQKERIVPFDRWAAESIDLYVEKGRPTPRDTDRLFLTEDGRPLSAGGIQTMLARLGRDAGLKERLSPHKLRHTFATNSLKYGGSLEYVKIILGHSDIKVTSDSYMNPEFGDVKAAHEKFSPLSNLLAGSVGEKTALHKDERPTDHQQDPEGRSKDMQPDASPADQSESRRVQEEAAQVGGTGPTSSHETETREAPGDTRLMVGFRGLYNEHARKLAVLAGELATDVDNGAIEARRHKPKIVPNSLFPGLDLARVYKSQNGRLWRFLSQHLDNEFVTPKLTAQISRAAADTVIKRIGGKESDEGALVRSIRETLILVSERGTFKGTCDVCRGYFSESGQEG